VPEQTEQYVYEEQTGRYFEIVKEERTDRVVATVSIVYLIAMIFFFLWQLFDIWVGKLTLARLFGYGGLEQLTQSSTLICIYTFIGGALGGIINEIRGFLFWHCDHGAYGRRYLSKAIISPWLGATLGIFVYFLMRSGIALFTGEFIPAKESIQQGIPMFTLGVLAGYGSRKVFIWLDSQVDRIFKLKKEKEKADRFKKVPNLTGMTKEEAEKRLSESKLKLGKVTVTPTRKMELVGKVVNQGIKPELWLDAGSSVDITIGAAEEE
jgi:hypothetical protein